MTPREKFHKALKREKITGHVPHYELAIYLTMEMIGRMHPSHRIYDGWEQMSVGEKKSHITDMAHCYIDIAKKYNHSAISVHTPPRPYGDFEMTRLLFEEIREQTGDTYSLIQHCDPTLAMLSGANMMEFSADMYENPEKLREQSKKNIEDTKNLVDKFSTHKGLVDGFAMCSDYCFNTNPFFTGEQFDEFIAPYLKETIGYMREHGFYTIKHTDGNIMPILNRLVDCEPDALHSLDPQGGVCLKDVKKLCGDKVCLIGNVNCGLLQTGTDEEAAADVRRALREGMDGYGYIFSTSNCIYTGLPLERYELMHSIWRKEGVYDA